MIRGKIFTVLLLCFLSQMAWSQDPIFSQWGLNPNAVNPALIGTYDGLYRAHIGYRDRWHSFSEENEFNALNLSYDYKLELGSNELNLGANILQDWSGESKLIQSRGYLSAGYQMQLSNPRFSGKYNFLAAAFQVGMGGAKPSKSRLWFGNQFDLGTYQVDENRPTGEPFIDDKVNAIYPDINIGLVWYTVFPRGGIHAGISTHHINTPNVSYISGASYKLDRRYTAHVGVKKLFSREFGISPSMVAYAQGNSFTGMIGTYLTSSLEYLGETGLSFGTWLRFSNTLENNYLEGLILAAKFENSYLQIGASYDVTLSNAGTYNSRMGGFELNVTYIGFGYIDEKNSLKLPGL